jgi:hypothetical protein
MQNTEIQFGFCEIPAHDDDVVRLETEVWKVFLHLDNDISVVLCREHVLRIREYFPEARVPFES